MAPFPPAPLRTAHDSFAVKPLSSDRLSNDGQFGFGAPHLAYLTAPGHPVTWATSPWARLSRAPWWNVTPTRTLGPPSPWDSPPIGDPMFRHAGTCRARRRCPTHALQCPRWASSSAQSVPPATAEHVARAGVGIRRAPDECAGPPLDLGVQGIHLSPSRAGVAGRYQTRLLLSPALPTCCCSLALSGLGQSFASESSALNSGPLRGQFAPCVTWRTLSPHAAHASPTPARGRGRQTVTRGLRRDLASLNRDGTGRLSHQATPCTHAQCAGLPRVLVL